MSAYLYMKFFLCFLCFCNLEKYTAATEALHKEWKNTDSLGGKSLLDITESPRLTLC